MARRVRRLERARKDAPVRKREIWERERGGDGEVEVEDGDAGDGGPVRGREGRWRNAMGFFVARRLLVWLGHGGWVCLRARYEQNSSQPLSEPPSQSLKRPESSFRR